MATYEKIYRTVGGNKKYNCYRVKNGDGLTIYPNDPTNKDVRRILAEVDAGTSTIEETEAD
tara:strand:+ start:258 stop:440 length:183 start_codon:yes stop_codon:yes gene_type:complete